MRGHNLCFCLEIRKITFELSSVPPLIWSSDVSSGMFQALLRMDKGLSRSRRLKRVEEVIQEVC